MRRQKAVVRNGKTPMATNSVNTNLGAMVALQSLNRTNEQLSAVQKRVSTGFRVADARDDGAAFAVAQGVRSDMAGLTSANEQLGGVKGILDTTLAGLGRVSTLMVEVRGVLVKLADGTISDDQRAQYQAQFDTLREQVATVMRDASYNNRSLVTTSGTEVSGLVGTAPSSLVAGSIVTVRNELGTNYTIDQVDGEALLVASAPTSPTAAAAMLTGTGTNDFGTVMNAINTALNDFGNSSRFVDSQISYNRQKLDSLESGLGSLIDADLAKESARLQALQIRQQLGTQALGIANQAPQSLLSLFQG
jgi:flagellin